VRRLPAGIVDASFASLATFAVGLAAVNLLPDTERGIYAIYFTAFLLGPVLPRSLILTPAEIEAVAYPQDERIALVPQSLLLGTGPSILGASAALLAAGVAAPLTDSPVIVPFTITTAIAAVLSPLQDHVRRMFHFGGRSWLAALVSVVQFTVAVSAILTLRQLDIELAYIPFGALALANLASLAVGWITTWRFRRHQSVPGHFVLRKLAGSGRWLLLQAAAPSAAGFVAAAIITRLASAAALGFAEAARVVAQPILVLGTGLAVVLNPRAIEAAMHRDRITARRTDRLYLLIIGAAGLGYLAVAGWSWSLNPMTALVPSAYEVTGLAALTILANVATAAIFLPFNELLGARKEITLAKISWGTAPVLLLGAATAGTTDAFARPIGRLAEATVKLAALRSALGHHYEAKPSQAPSPPS
jgi:O-antigen/teichoic acid export membrane protein